MRYFGGKQRISKELSDFINRELEPDQPFVDLFCGSCNVISKIDSNRLRIANDLHKELISLLLYCKNEGVLPTHISSAEYNMAKQGICDDWFRGFVGFGCSFSGKWFGGYARGGESRNYALNARNSLMKKFENMKDVFFFNSDYRDVKIPSGSLVYCDIPYKETTKYSVGSFDHDSFYDWCRTQKDLGVRVIVSEYKHNSPVGARIIWEKKSKKDIRNSSGEQEKTIEILFEF